MTEFVYDKDIPELTYDPSVFDVKNLSEAKDIILTGDPNISSRYRWYSETPYLLTMLDGLDLSEQSVVIDYGVGIGRMAKAIIDKYNCKVVGIDQSESMLTLSKEYVNSSQYYPFYPQSLDISDIQADLVIAVWVLQHCLNYKEDIERIKKAMKPDGKLFVVSTTYRCVPVRTVHSKEFLWINDGINLREYLDNEFELLESNKLDPDIVSQNSSDLTFQATYRRR